jgi:glycosyltransferase involved in cell wall biosynthesis
MTTKIKNNPLSPCITVITVNYNNSIGLEKTINSVIQQDYSNYQYLIIDGESTDGSIDLINSFDKNEFYKIIEKDEGIYHAMNKAISIADGEWLLFMNSGDVFFDSSSLSSAMLKSANGCDVIYANWIYAKSGKKINASKQDMIIRHQSVMYKKSLHVIYGTYVVSPNVTISDYIFFSSIQSVKWRYHDKPLSVCDESGVSSNVSHFYQKVSVDFIFGRGNKVMLITILALYPVYKMLKKTWISIVKFI